jgi:hypothetical protein
MLIPEFAVQDQDLLPAPVGVALKVGAGLPTHQGDILGISSLRI